MDSISEVKEATIFFDGVCNFCNSTINFVIDRDPQNFFRFSSLQSEYAKSILPKYGVDTSQLYSIILLKDGRVYEKSSAALEVARNMKGLWPSLYVFKIIPAFLRNIIYDFIARNRYKWFGKMDSCRLPTPELRERFLDSTYSV